MAELRPHPLGALIRRAFSELDRHDSVFDLPRRKFFGDPGGKDLSVRFHGHVASSPLGPAAGPQSQMAQNIVLSWLGGCRIMELKTVQIDDELKIPRPCIDMQTVGYNVEWSQELKLEQSLEEYVKGAMLIEILRKSGELEVAASFASVVHDMSVGYDLAGIKTERVQAFIDGMLDCSAVIERLRPQIPDEYKRYRDLDFPSRLSDTLTLSTFHGCPPDEIERMLEFLIQEKGLHCVIKLNPTLLGKKRARSLLADQLGYHEIRIPDSAFDKDTHWDQALGFVDRLGQLAEHEGKHFGVKFTNTLVVENHRDFFAGEKLMYLSGPPLHVLAMNLVGDFRDHYGDRFPVSFSAGIDRHNFADAVAIGLVPVTVCSDLLKPGGYGRAHGYLSDLCERMERVGAHHISDYVLRAYGHGEKALEEANLGERAQACKDALARGGDLREAARDRYDAWVSAARVLNTTDYVARCTADSRYAHDRNKKLPRKVGSQLELFNCLTCDKCVPVCPNDANFAFVLPQLDIPIVILLNDNGVWRAREQGRLTINKKAQYGTFADFCNDCGNCDVFCPEDGGPYLVKPRFFGSKNDWRDLAHLDGFCFEQGDEGVSLTHGRFSGNEYHLERRGQALTYRGEHFDIRFEQEDPGGTVSGTADGEVDLSFFHIMQWLEAAVFAGHNNYLRYSLLSR